MDFSSMTDDDLDWAGRAAAEMADAAYRSGDMVRVEDLDTLADQVSEERERRALMRGY